MTVQSSETEWGYPTSKIHDFANEITGHIVPTWLRFPFLIRAALLTQATTVVCLGWWAQSSLTARLFERGGVPATWVLCAMSALVVVGLVDALINDVLPDRFTLTYLKRRRHLTYMVLGGIYMVQVFAGISDSPTGAGILLANYTAGGLLCGAFAAAATLRPSYAL